MGMGPREAVQVKSPPLRSRTFLNSLIWKQLSDTTYVWCVLPRPIAASPAATRCTLHEAGLTPATSAPGLGAPLAYPPLSPLGLQSLAQSDERRLHKYIHTQHMHTCTHTQSHTHTHTHTCRCASPIASHPSVMPSDESHAVRAEVARCLKLTLVSENVTNVEVCQLVSPQLSVPM